MIIQNDIVNTTISTSLQNPYYGSGRFIRGRKWHDLCHVEKGQ